LSNYRLKNLPIRRAVPKLFPLGSYMYQRPPRLLPLRPILLLLSAALTLIPFDGHSSDGARLLPDTKIAEPVLGGVAVALIIRAIERRARARLTVFYGHVARFRIQPTAATAMQFDVHTHSIVIKNGGRLPAHNVRVPHALPFSLSAINVFVDPGINYTQSTLPGGGDEILIPILVAGQQAAIHYLYYPPLTFNQINLAITCDEGIARALTVLPTIQLRPWQLWSMRALLLVGAITVVYVLIRAVEWVIGALG
jgi:hypothetical protein